MKNQEKAECEFTRNKKEGAGLERLKTEEVDRKKKLRRTKGNMKNKRETQRVIINTRRVTAIRP